MTTRIGAFTTAVVLVMAGAAWAADILTPTLQVGVGTPGTSCTVLNTGTRAVQDITITIRDQDNNVRATLVDNISAGGAQTVGDDSPANTQYCRVSGISKSAARVTFCLLDAASKCTVAVTAP